MRRMPQGDTNMALTDLAIKRALPGTKIMKLSDGGGLQLWITPDGAKRWRVAYRFRAVEKTLAGGVYPDVGLKDARNAREEARRNLARGEDPSLVKRAAKGAKAEEGANTFTAIADELRKRSGEKRKRRQHYESSNGS